MPTRQQRIRREGWGFVAGSAIVWTTYVVLRLSPLERITYEGTSVPPTVIFTSLVGPFLVMLAPPLLVVGIALLRTSFLWEPTPTPEPDVDEDLGLLPPVFL